MICFIGFENQLSDFCHRLLLLSIDFHLLLLLLVNIPSYTFKLCIDILYFIKIFNIKFRACSQFSMFLFRSTSTHWRAWDAFLLPQTQFLFWIWRTSKLKVFIFADRISCTVEIHRNQTGLLVRSCPRQFLCCLWPRNGVSIFVKLLN